MKKILILIVFISEFVYSQEKDKALLSLVNAERSFSKMSAETNLRTAFLYFFAPNSIANEGGKEVNGVEHSKKMKVDSSLVTWQPNFADIAVSKDFGYTTGPVTFYRTRMDTVPQGAIYYSTMWERQPGGDWKVIFDLGSAMAEPVPPALSFTKKPLALRVEMVSKKDAIADVLLLDREYIARLNAKNATVESSYFSDEGRVHRPGIFPLRGSAAIASYADTKDRVYVYTHLNGNAANSGDLAFTYGTVDITINSNANPQKSGARYFRVWKKEAGGRKIVLDVLG